MEKKNECKTMNEGRKQCPSCIDDKTKMLMNWYHGSTTRFINDASSICGSVGENEGTEKRGIFTAFIVNELVRLGEILDIKVTTSEVSSESEDEEYQYFGNEDIKDTLASEEIQIYKDILSGKISEIARLRTEVNMLSTQLSEQESANQK